MINIARTLTKACRQPFRLDIRLAFKHVPGKIKQHSRCPKQGTYNKPMIVLKNFSLPMIVCWATQVLRHSVLEPLIFFPDPVLNSLMARAGQRQSQARAPGTQANHRTAVKRYLGFCHRFNIQPSLPTEHQVCAYIETLADRQMPQVL